MVGCLLHFGNFLAIISSHIYSAFFFLLSSLISVIHMSALFDVIPQHLNAPFSFVSFFFFPVCLSLGDFYFLICSQIHLFFHLLCLVCQYFCQKIFLLVSNIMFFMSSIFVWLFKDSFLLTTNTCRVFFILFIILSLEGVFFFPLIFVSLIRYNWTVNIVCNRTSGTEVIIFVPRSGPASCSDNMLAEGFSQSSR